MSRRTERIAEQIRSELARVLREEATDPRLSLVTITEVDVAPDLGNAVVFWSALDVEGKVDLDQVQAGLESAASFCRRRLARELPLRRMPELRFRHDPSLEQGTRTLALLREISDESAS
jgi:ribosome-binding factor A